MNKKKTYQHPTTQVILLTNRTVLLDASGGAGAPRRDYFDEDYTSEEGD